MNVSKPVRDREDLDLSPGITGQVALPSPSVEATVPVLVFGSSLTATGVVRSLGRARIPTFSICSGKDFLASSRWYRPLAYGSRCPVPDELPEFLKSLSIRHAVLMPCADDWVTAVANLPPELKERFPASSSSAGVMQCLVDKWRFAELLEQEALPHPQTTLLGSLEEMWALPASCYENRFLKPRGSLEFGRRHRAKAFVIKDKADALLTMAKTQQNGAAGDFPIMLQEYIPGPPANHYFVDGFVDRHGRICALFARRRLRMFPPLFGNSTFMESVALDSVRGALDTIEKLVAALEYRGILSAEFKYDERDGLFKILEVNARPWWYIEFAARSGVDVCGLAYCDALGMPVDPISTYQVGRRCVYLPNDFRAYRLDHHGAGSLIGWVRSWAGADEAVFCRDDPGPSISYVSDGLKELVRRIVRRER